MAFLVGSGAPGLQRLAVPFASLLIAVLGYGSQWLFANSPDLEPGPLTPTQTRIFNTLLVCLWWTYWRACTVDPGRYEFPRPSGKKDNAKAAAAAAAKKNKRDEDTAAHISDDEDDEGGDQAGSPGSGHNAADERICAAARRRWCRKCAAPKPPRAHHCKSCGRCVPRMDHHCPWTGNCVGLQTFPHFVRFIMYTNVSLWTLLYFFWLRFQALWASRNLPAYLGPTLGQLVALTALTGTACFTALALGVLLVTTVKGWLFNTTMIEGWEIDRHEAVLRRGGYEEEDDWWRTSDGDADAAPRSMVDPLEFPYDVGVYANMAQAMGTPNPIYWFLPFAGGPRVARLSSTTTLESLVAELGGAKAGSAGLGVGWAYEENGLNDREGMWPPIDPDKVRNARLWRQRRREEDRYRREQAQGRRNPALPNMSLSPEEEKEAFRRRQERDLRRWRGARAQMMDELEETHHRYGSGGEGEGEGEGDYDFVDEARSATHTLESYRPRRHVVHTEGKSGWVNADGEHLGDYGVDEDAEFDDDDLFVFDDGPGGGGGGGHASRAIDPNDEEVPLAELIRRRKVRTKDGEDT
ncbi:zf-DHHC-domain-containing protein [Xylaria longipes]|nr:zf-DHHC-domain-containing protein [Xylaria longipes]